MILQLLEKTDYWSKIDEHKRSIAHSLNNLNLPNFVFDFTHPLVVALAKSSLTSECLRKILTDKALFHSLYVLLLGLPQKIDHVFTNMEDHISQHTAEGSERWLISLGLSLNKINEIGSELEKADAVRQVDFDGMHYTELNRHQDSNEFLSESNHLLKLKAPIIFMGASLGATALALKKHLSKDKKSEVFALDLHHPRYIFKRFNRTDNYKKLSVIQHIQADMASLPFKNNSMAMIDACNCLGYLSFREDRDEVVRRLWRILKNNGLLRVTTPGSESLFEHMVFKKTGPNIDQFELLYAGINGKTYESWGLSSLEERKEISRQALILREKLRKHFKDLKPPSINDEIHSFFHDLYHLNPVSYASGVLDYSFLQFVSKFEGMPVEHIFKQKADYLKNILIKSDLFLEKIFSRVDVLKYDDAR